MVWEGSEGRYLLGEGSMGAALLASEGGLGRSRPCSGRRGQTGAFKVIHPSSCCPPLRWGPSLCTVTARQASGLCRKLLPAAGDGHVSALLQPRAACKPTISERD